MATPLVALRLAEDLIEHYDVIAERLGSNRTEVMRAALEQVRDANPVDEDELSRFRAKKAKGKVKVTLGPGNVLKASLVAEERPDIAATRELAAAGGSEPRMISAHTQRRSRPDARPAGQRRRHLRAV